MSLAVSHRTVTFFDDGLDSASCLTLIAVCHTWLQGKLVHKRVYHKFSTSPLHEASRLAVQLGVST